ncbi:MAG: HDOD domain-containing protein [Planctomycetota bacterium]|jgi:HD-like signal output (HDOD) protein
MKRILFVDDEANVLQGLQRMLRPMRREWEMTFCPGGQEALRALADDPFDVIVSDMRMPGLDGAALLAEVARQYPQVVRIVLSGQSSRETTLQSIGVAHQFLAKPCDPERLKQTVSHAFALRDLLSDETLKRALSRLKSVPSMPAVYTELVEELRYSDASVRRVGEIISQDPGMTTKVLQLVNSAFFGVPRQVSSPGHAASLLGTDTIKALVLGIDVFSRFKDTTVEGISPESVQKHSADTAATAKQIAMTEKAAPNVADASLMAGFLHDVGKLILAQNLPEQYGKVLAMHKNGVSLCEAERKEFGATHAQVGAYLLGLWGLPDRLVEATAFHHCPGESFGQSFSPVTAVHVANVLVHGHTNEGEGEELDLDYLARLGIADRVPTWRAACQTAIDNGGNA